MIICVTSLIRAGKDAFADYIVERYGFVKLNLSDVLRDDLVERCIEPTKEEMSKLGDEWRQKYGMDVVMRKTLEKAKDYSKVVIAGVRSMEEFDFMKNNAKDVSLLAVIAEREVRFKRRSDLDPETEDKFFARDERDIKNKGLDKVMAVADYKIENNFETLDEFYKEIDKLMEKMRVN